MKVELFGAAFDPPHIGHRQVAEGMLDLGICDELWLVPAKQHCFLKTHTEIEHRLAMLKLFLEDFPKETVKIETRELNRETPRYTFDTLTYFADTQPVNTFACLIGSDKLSDFHCWYRVFDLLRRFSVHVYPRPGYPMNVLRQGMIPLTGVPEIDISSTEVITKVAAGKDVSNLVGNAISEYIRENRLYLNPWPTRLRSNPEN